jgi:hypothetical protein
MAALVIVLLAPVVFLSGCYMTPEDKAFYGRGWWNPSELDVQQPPPREFTDPTAINPQPGNDEEY